MFFVCISLNIFPGKFSIRFANTSLKSTNQTFITDDSTDSCSAFQTTDNASLLQYTQLRLMPLAGQRGSINVTIIGVSLGCGYNLYVSVLSLDQSKHWLGRWSTCNLLDTSRYGTKENCSYFCSSPLYWSEIQVMKFPHSSDESFWEICHFGITGK